MASIFGFTNNKEKNANNLKGIRGDHEIKPSLVYKLDEQDFISSIIRNSNATQVDKHVFREDKIGVFFIGSCFNLKDIQIHFSLLNKDLPKIIFDLYKEGQIEELLSLMNGTFSIVISDVEKKTIKIISDRFGLQPLFYYNKNKQFAWGSNINRIINLPFVLPELSHRAIDCFMEHGHLLGAHTYFKNIKQLPPASILTYNYEDHIFLVQQYWTWQEVKPSDVSFEKAVQETGRLFIQAVQRQFTPDGSMGVSLSGGLDSRLIIAAIHKLYPKYRGFAYTFGQKNCVDAKIAKQVAEVANWDHQFYLIDKHNWFEKRLDAILETEGMKSIIHFHGCEHIDLIKERITTNLNGYLGGAVLGGRSMNYYTHLDQKIDKELARIIYGTHGLLTNPDHSYYAIDHPDVLVINNRGRRLINLGLVAITPFVEQRRVFMDNDLVSFLFSLPKEYRMNHRLFKAVALEFFPSFFRTISWQKTQLPIKSEPSLLIKIYHLGLRVLRRFNPFSKPSHYSNYQEWMQVPDMEKQLKKALLSKDTPLLSHFKATDLLHFFKKYQQNEKGIMMKVGRLFTLYYYFKSIDLNKLLDSSMENEY